MQSSIRYLPFASSSHKSSVNAFLGQQIWGKLYRPQVESILLAKEHHQVFKSMWKKKLLPHSLDGWRFLTWLTQPKPPSVKQPRKDESLFGISCFHTAATGDLGNGFEILLALGCSTTLSIQARHFHTSVLKMCFCWYVDDYPWLVFSVFWLARTWGRQLNVLAFCRVHWWDLQKKYNATNGR